MRTASTATQKLNWRDEPKQSRLGTGGQKMANEKRLIYADDAIELINGLESLPWEEETEEMVNSLATVDAVEVVHGRWINKTKEIHGMVDERNDCSNCGQVYWFACPDFNYCPNCGADMRERINNEEVR
jgi:hypothetical protein